MNKKEFFETLATLVKQYHTNGSKLEQAKVEDALAFCEYHADSNNTDTDAPAPTNYSELLEELLCNAGGNELRMSRKWESYVRGCAPLCLTPNADAIRDHYFTPEQIAKNGLCWGKCPRGYEDWQEFEASRLDAASDMLVNIAFGMGLFSANR